MSNAASHENALTRPLAHADVIILAGGFGTRLAPVFPGRPKVLAPLAGRPILDHLLGRLRRHGARRIILALGHLSEQVCNHVEKGFEGLDLVASIETEPLGTAGAIAKALPLMLTEHAVIMNGDSLIDIDFAAFVSWAKTNAIEAALVAAHVDHARRYGVLTLDNRDVVQAFAEKPGGDGPAWINAGVYWLSSSVLRMLVEIGQGSLERDILPRLPAGRLHAYRSFADFIDIGTKESFARAAQWPIEADDYEKGVCP